MRPTTAPHSATPAESSNGGVDAVHGQHGHPSGDNLRIRIVSQASFRLDDFKLTGEK
ncbi:MAG: hypothetical protein ACLR8Y_08700 [Alistipes indistinctus]